MNSNKKFIPYKIRSKDRANGDEINDFQIYLHSLDQINENYELHLRNFTINNDFLNVNTLNNTLNFQYDTNLGITTPAILQDLNLTLPSLNYNASQFITGFNTQAPLDGITGLSVAFNSQNNLLTYTNGTSLGTDLIFNVNENQKFLGLENGSYNLGTTGTLVSNQPADFSGIKEINVILENVPLESYNTENYNNNILATIPVNSNYNERIIYENDYPISTETKNINKLHLRLLDENNEPVQARSDYVMNLQFIDTQPN